MRIHSNVLTSWHFMDAAGKAGVGIIGYAEHGSRSRARATDFTLTGTSSYQANFGRDHRAATWDEWGIFLAHLFSVDPQAHCGKNSYLSAEHFHWTTGNRFATLSTSDQHKRHAWGVGQMNITGVYSVAQCNCGAIQRWVICGHTFAEISDYETPAPTPEPVTKPEPTNDVRLWPDNDDREWFNTMTERVKARHA